MKRSPWLATLGMVCGFAAGIVWAAIADSITMLDSMAQVGLNPLFVTVEHHYFSTWLILAFGTFWVIGHLLGYVLVFIGSVPAALAFLKRRDEQAHALVPTVEELPSAN